MLSVILFSLLLLVNFGISWANAHTCGMYWSESKVQGGFFRVNIVAGYIMSVAGFTMVYGYILIILASVIVPLVPQLSDIDVIELTTLTSDMLYLLLVMTIIPSGFFIWIKSLSSFWEKRNFSTGITAVWNTYAQMHNTISVARNAPSAISRLGKALFGGKSKKKAETYLVLAAIFLIIVAALGGYFTASSIMKKADREHDILDKYQYNYQS